MREGGKGRREGGKEGGRKEGREEGRKKEGRRGGRKLAAKGIGMMRNMVEGICVLDGVQ